MYYSAVFHVDAAVVLGFLVKLNVLKGLLELESVAHLVKEESNRDVAESLVGVKPFCLDFEDIHSELIAVRDCERKITSQNAGEVEHRSNKVVLGRNVDLQVRPVISCQNQTVEALVAPHVELVQSEADEESIHVEVGACLCEGGDWLLVPVIVVGRLF